MIYVADTGEISPIEKPGFYPVYPGPKPEIQPGQSLVEFKLVKEEDHWIQTYQVINLPTYTAGEWLEMVGLGAAQQPTLIYLKLSLQSVGKSSAKLNMLESYLQNILGQYAIDATPRYDWPHPPVGYQETISECVSLLQPLG